MRCKKNNHKHRINCNHNHNNNHDNNHNNMTTFKIFRSSNIRNERITATKYTNAD